MGLVINYLKEEDNLLDNYGYKYKYNNEIYKYYNKADLEKIPESKTEEKARFKLQFSKEIIVKNFIRFKKWIDFLNHKK